VQPNSTQKYALWIAHGRRCPYCAEPIAFDVLEIDHVIPYWLNDEPRRPEALLNRLNLPGFDINCYLNWLPVHGQRCNREKGGEILSDGALYYFLSIARLHEEKARAEEKRIRQRALAEHVLAPVKCLVEDGLLSHEEVISSILSASPDRLSVATSDSFGKAAAFQEAARRYYRAGNYEESYLACVRGTEIFSYAEFYTDAVECLIEAISALRPTRSGRRLKKTVLQIERLCAQVKIGLIARWHFLDRLQLILFDYGRWGKAGEVEQASARLRHRITKEAGNPQRLEFDLANSRRRAAVIKGCANTFARGENLGKVLTELADEGREFKKRRQFNAAITNFDVASKLAAEILDDRELAHGFSEEALEFGSLCDNFWVRQEHHWREFKFFTWKGDDAGQEWHALQGIKLQQDHPVVLTPVLIGGRPQAFNPLNDHLVELRMEGLAHEGIIKIRGHVSAIPFDLSDDRIDAILRTVLR